MTNNYLARKRQEQQMQRLQRQKLQQQKARSKAASTAHMPAEMKEAAERLSAYFSLFKGQHKDDDGNLKIFAAVDEAFDDDDVQVEQYDFAYELLEARSRVEVTKMAASSAGDPSVGGAGGKLQFELRVTSLSSCRYVSCTATIGSDGLVHKFDFMKNQRGS